MFLPGAGFAEPAFEIPDRRKPQFESEPGFALLPFPYSLPGIGSGISLASGFTNIKDTYVDAYGLLLAGDIQGAALGIDDIHLLPKRLILELGASSIDKASITSYNQRGMRSEKDDFSLIELSNIASIGSRLTVTFFDRRFELYGAYYKFWSQLNRIRDNDGDIIIDVDDPSIESGEQRILGMLIDLTDDYHDPRAGFRFDISGWYNAKTKDGPEYLLLDLSATTYFPMGKRSTWLFNVFKSDATLFSKGETDRAIVADQMGLDCSTVTDPKAQAQCNKHIDTVVDGNKYGTASSLGGFSRLRSYSQGRYGGAHTLFFGTELRWNLTDEFTPFNIYVIKDVRTAIQIAFFYEIGSVSEKESEIGDVTRSTYGTGVRIVTASGAVFRGDFAFGEEGFQPNVFIGYPWEF